MDNGELFCAGVIGVIAEDFCDMVSIPGQDMMAAGHEAGLDGGGRRVDPGMIAETRLFIPLAVRCEAKYCPGMIVSEDH